MVGTPFNLKIFFICSRIGFIIRPSVLPSLWLGGVEWRTCVERCPPVVVLMICHRLKRTNALLSVRIHASLSFAGPAPCRASQCRCPLVAGNRCCWAVSSIYFRLFHVSGHCRLCTVASFGKTMHWNCLPFIASTWYRRPVPVTNSSPTSHGSEPCQVTRSFTWS